jgi:DNA polymerase
VTGFASFDLETFSEADLSEVGTYLYAEHPSTRVLCVAYSVNGGPVQLWPHRDSLQPLIDVIRAGGTVQGHNVEFDMVLWNRTLRRSVVVPEIKPEQLSCTRARSAMHGLPQSLADVGQALALSTQKDFEGRALMLKLCRPAKPVKAEGDAPNPLRLHTPENLQRLGAYCARDVETEQAIGAVVPELTQPERTVYLVTHRINERGWRVDLPLVRALKEQAAARQVECSVRIAELTGGKVKAFTKVANLTEWLRSKGVNVPGVDRHALMRALRTTEGDVRAVIEARLNAARSSVAKLDAILAQTHDRYWLCRGQFVYAGAGATGRWSARGVQLQNLPRVPEPVAAAFDAYRERAMSGSLTLAEISQMLRGCFTASPARLLLQGDYKQIELRVLLWLAGEDEWCEYLTRPDGDLYKIMAARIYRTTPETITKPQRFVGKTAVLGCGYGVGAARFAEACDEAGQPVTDDEAKSAVLGYRQTFGGVPDLWQSSQIAAFDAVRDPSREFSCAKGRITYRMVDGVLRCRLPSSRELWYRKPRIERAMKTWSSGGRTEEWVLFYDGINTLTRRYEKTSTWGGRLVENFVQATARDLMARALCRLEAAKFSVVGTIHDSAISDEYGEGRLAEFKGIMENVPAWAAGCPIEVDAEASYRFK